LKEKAQNKVGGFLELPPDVLSKGPKITIVGRSNIIVESYQDVILFSNEEIILKTFEGRLSIKGNNFVLTAILAAEINIRGVFFGLSFEEEGR